MGQESNNSLLPMMVLTFSAQQNGTWSEQIRKIRQEFQQKSKLKIKSRLSISHISRYDTHLLILILGHRQSRFLLGTNSPTEDFRWLLVTTSGLVDLNTVCTCRLKRTSSRGTCLFEDVVRPVTFAMIAVCRRENGWKTRREMGYFRASSSNSITWFFALTVQRRGKRLSGETGRLWKITIITLAEFIQI